MPELVLRAPAKLNLALDVVGRRPDGYHELDTVMQSVNIFDIITINIKRGPGIVLTCDQKRLPCGPGNLAYRAAALLLEAADAAETGVRIHLEKHIPAQAGMGGGSADAAAVLLGLDRLLGLGWGPERLCNLGVRLGADVPFCTVGGARRCRGVGEQMELLPPMPDCFLVVAKPRTGVQTARCFARFDILAGLERATLPDLRRPRDPERRAGAAAHAVERGRSVGCFVRPDVDRLAAALRAGDLHAAAAQTSNVLESAAALPELGRICGVMRTFGALGAAMTGSGSAVFGVFETAAAAERCRAQLRRTLRWVQVARPVAYGPAELF